jgi:aerobic-type carbon monoxide dehydrogenase small subunit (CoxS/CutS family)
MIVALCGFCAVGFIAIAKLVLAMIFNTMQDSIDAWP